MPPSTRCAGPRSFPRASSSIRALRVVRPGHGSAVRVTGAAVGGASSPSIEWSACPSWSRGRGSPRPCAMATRAHPLDGDRGQGQDLPRGARGIGGSARARRLEVRAWSLARTSRGGTLAPRRSRGHRDSPEGTGRHVRMKPRCRVHEVSAQDRFSEERSRIARASSAGSSFCLGAGPARPRDQGDRLAGSRRAGRGDPRQRPGRAEAGGTAVDTWSRWASSCAAWTTSPSSPRVQEYFKGVKPARTTVEASAPRKGVNVEIDCIAGSVTARARTGSRQALRRFCGQGRSVYPL